MFLHKVGVESPENPPTQVMKFLQKGITITGHYYSELFGSIRSEIDRDVAPFG